MKKVELFTKARIIMKIADNLGLEGEQLTALMRLSKPMLEEIETATAGKPNRKGQ